MSDNLVLEHLRHLRAAMDGLRDGMGEVKHRLTAVEIGIAGMRRDDAGLAEAVAHLGARCDRMSERLDRIERRLDIV